ncbi:MAG: sigma-70 family RNA polymerase sigma factor [Bacteroidales bacterium]
MSPKESKEIGDVYRSVRGNLLGYIRKRIPARMEAEDILQDVFYQLTLGFRDLGEIRDITAWLYRVTRNRIIDNYRKKRPSDVGYGDRAANGEEGPLSLEEILPAIGSSPEDDELKELIWEKISDILEELPREQRDVFIATEFEDMSFKALSEKTGIGINTLISRKRYAVLALRKQLDELYKLFKSK